MDGGYEAGPAGTAAQPAALAATTAANPPVVATVLDRRPLSSEVTTLRSPSSSVGAVAAGLAVAAALPPPSSWVAVPPGSPAASLQASNAELLRQEVFEKEQRLRERDAKEQEERWRQLESERLRALEQQQRRLAEEHQRQCEQREVERQHRRELELQRQEAERIEDQEAVRKVQEAAAQRQLLREALQLEFQEAERAARFEKERHFMAQRRVAELLQRKRRGADPRRLRAAKEEQRPLVKHRGFSEQGVPSSASPVQAVPRARQHEPPRRSATAPAGVPAAPRPTPAPESPSDAPALPAAEAAEEEEKEPPLPLQRREEEEKEEEALAGEAAQPPLLEQQPRPESGIEAAAPLGPAAREAEAEAWTQGPAAPPAPAAPAVAAPAAGEGAVVVVTMRPEPPVGGGAQPLVEDPGAPEPHEVPSEQRSQEPELPTGGAKGDDDLSAMCSRLHQAREVVLAQSPETQESAEGSPSDVQRKLDETFAALEESKLGSPETPQAADAEVPSHPTQQEEVSHLQDAARLREEDPRPEGSPLSWQSPGIDSAASPNLQCRGTSEGTSLGLASPADRFEAREAEELRRERQEAEARQLEAERAAKGEKKEADAFVVALLALRKRYKDSDLAGLVTCLQTLRVYIKNLASNPLDRKFQRISCENNAFRSRVAPYEGAVAVLEACGFKPSGPNLVVDDSFTKTKGPRLWDALSKLDVLLGQLKAAA